MDDREAYAAALRARADQMAQRIYDDHIKLAQEFDHLDMHYAVYEMANVLADDDASPKALANTFAYFIVMCARRLGHCG